eukprot:31176-Pelagococcus_subviridis.AAC.9
MRFKRDVLPAVLVMQKEHLQFGSGGEQRRPRRRAHLGPHALGHLRRDVRQHPGAVDVQRERVRARANQRLDARAPTRRRRRRQRRPAKRLAPRRRPPGRQHERRRAVRQQQPRQRRRDGRVRQRRGDGERGVPVLVPRVHGAAAARPQVAAAGPVAVSHADARTRRAPPRDASNDRTRGELPVARLRRLPRDALGAEDIADRPRRPLRRGRDDVVVSVSVSIALSDAVVHVAGVHRRVLLQPQSHVLDASRGDGGVQRHSRERRRGRHRRDAFGRRRVRVRVRRVGVRVLGRAAADARARDVDVQVLREAPVADDPRRRRAARGGDERRDVRAAPGRAMQRRLMRFVVGVHVAYRRPRGRGGRRVPHRGLVRARRRRRGGLPRRVRRVEDIVQAAELGQLRGRPHLLFFGRARRQDVRGRDVVRDRSHAPRDARRDGEWSERRLLPRRAAVPPRAWRRATDQWCRKWNAD